MKKVSVVIPVYNTERFVKKCITSVMKQSLKEIEIILINDASPDNALAICKKLQKKDDRIIIIDKKQNEGVEKAREAGYKIAKGAYIAFVDSDDWLPADSLRKMYDKAKQNNADIVVGRVQKVLDKYPLIKKNNIFSVTKNKLLSSDKFIQNYYKAFFGINLFDVSMWGKLYRKEILLSQEILPLKYHMGEDLIFNIQVFLRAQSVLFIDDFVYYYRFGGITTSFNKNLLPAEFEMFTIKKRMIKKYHLEHLTKFIYIEFKNYLKTHIGMHIRFNRYKITKELIDEIEELLNTHPLIIELIEYFKQHPHPDEFVKALIQKDVNKMCTLVLQIEKKNKWKIRMRKFISDLLN